MKKNLIPFFVMCFLFATVNFADDAYRLWLKYDLIPDEGLLKEYNNNIQAIIFKGESPTIQIAKKEFNNGLTGAYSG